MIVPGDIQRQDAVEAIAPHSDNPPQWLRIYADVFVDAHRRAPGGLSIEFGTRRGGSALLWLSLIDTLYRDAPRPSLFTVDPYGGKVYDAGDSLGAYFYGDEHYLAAKSNLALHANHAHFLMTSLAFLERMHGLSYWRDGHRLRANDLTFAFLDGEHDVDTIAAELHVLWGSWMGTGGLVLIDNVSNDPKTKELLEKHYAIEKLTEHYAVISGKTSRP